MQRVLVVLDGIIYWSGKIITPLLGIIMAVLTYEIVMRYVFNAPTIWAHETSTYVFAIYVLLAGGYTLREGFFVRMDILYVRFPSRAKAIVDLFTSWIALSYILCMLWWGGITAWESLKVWEVSTTVWAPPIYPVKVAITLAAFLLLVEWFVKFIRDLITATNSEESL